MKNENVNEEFLSTLSFDTKKVVLEIIDHLEKLLETSSKGKPVLLETADYRSDGYNDKSLVYKLAEEKLLSVEGEDEFGHPFIQASLETVRKFKNNLQKSLNKEIIDRQAAEQALYPGGGFVPAGNTPEEKMQYELDRIAKNNPNALNSQSNNDHSNYDFTDIPTSWLKQELFVAQSILAKLTYYGSEEILMRMSEFYSNYFTPPGRLSDAYLVLGRISEVLKKFQNLNLIHDLDFGEPEMQNTTLSLSPYVDKLRLYKAILMKEIKLREGGDSEITDQSQDPLVNGQLSYSIDNREINYANNKPLGLDPSSDYGRFLILLMSNLDKRVTYTQICDAIGRDYKVEDINPESDPSVKREIQQIKKDLLARLKKAGVPPQVLSELIVARDGYKMNKIS